jgi:hypothetical protein
MYHFLLRGASLHFPVQLFACSAAGLRGRLHMQLDEGARPDDRHHAVHVLLDG